MKASRNLILLTLLFFGFSSNIIAKEITLYNSEGEAVAYIDTDDEDLTIYLWNGKPVAYLEPNGDDYNIYGFNGKHLGWYEDGIINLSST